MTVAETDTTSQVGQSNPAAGFNMDYLEEIYQRWRENPASVGDSWQLFFQGFELSSCPRNCVAAQQARDQSAVASLIYAYRSEGHRFAHLDPLDAPRGDPWSTDPGRFGLSEADLDRVFDTGHLGGPSRAPLREIIQILRETYCRTLGVEYIFIQDVRIRRWLQAQMEPTRNRPGFSRDKQLEILSLLVDAELFETFLQSRYLGQKRFSLEGAESVIAGLHALVELAPELGIEEIVMGMAHRGRLNVLANILDKSHETIFGEFEDMPQPSMPGGYGDVKYHKGFRSTHINRNGLPVRLDLTANPSHLEAVDPVVEGKVRARQRRLGDTERRSRVLPLLVHGDAAFSGQGLVAELLNLSQLEGYRTGGTVHLIINNQIGFTTLPSEGRSTGYATDVVKMIEAPIFHVNADDPEAVVQACELALRFRQEFGRDVVVDIVCYRRHGHNEVDEPTFTQPVLYAKIQKHPRVRQIYTRQLLDRGVLDEAAADHLADEFKQRLQTAFESSKLITHAGEIQGEEYYDDPWVGSREPFGHMTVETGLSQEVLVEVTRALTTVPEGFALNPKVARMLPDRMSAIREGGQVDWAFAEALAIGSLLAEGYPVRISGQDSPRGTFSQRHAVWVDLNTQQSYIPANHIRPGQARFCVYNSALSEAAVLGFDYGYSLDEPNMLLIWEAQFGDFANGAQVIFDQFVASSWAKWQRASGIVMLLPHGYEGQGPEHSNAYLERYLAACAEENLQVCNLTTPAQYFHVLRRQLARPFRRPLVIMSPKSLLRHPDVVSPVADLVVGHFQEILDDAEPPPKARRVALCSGKVYYELAEARRKAQVDDLALVRVEQLYPPSRQRMDQVVERYPDVQEVMWVQEEPRNRGAWGFMLPHLAEYFDYHRIRYVGRPPSASPATGSMRIHREEQARLIRQAIEPDSEPDA